MRTLTVLAVVAMGAFIVALMVAGPRLSIDNNPNYDRTHTGTTAPRTAP